MKQAGLETFSRTLLAEGIANTFEYPGYINIQYRGFDVTIGIDGDLMLIQISKDSGETFTTPKQFTFRADTITAHSDILPKIKRLLCDAYLIVDSNFE